MHMCGKAKLSRVADVVFVARPLNTCEEEQVNQRGERNS